jgi:hypothetical protein
VKGIWKATLVLGCLLLLGGTAAALAGGAQSITVVERELDVNPGELNPCTGATGTIVDDEQDVFHITFLPDATHLTGHSTVDVTFVPDDPRQVAYAGHETFAVSEGSTSHNFVTTMTNHVRVKGTDGTFVTLHEVAHLTVTPDGVAVSFDRPTFVCS